MKLWEERSAANEVGDYLVPQIVLSGGFLDFLKKNMVGRSAGPAPVIRVVTAEHVFNRRVERTTGRSHHERPLGQWAAGQASTFQRWPFCSSFEKEHGRLTEKVGSGRG